MLKQMKSVLKQGLKLGVILPVFAILIYECGNQNNNGYTVPGTSGGNYVGPGPNPPDQNSCLGAGGTWLAGNICKQTYGWLIMGYIAGYQSFYWLAGVPTAWGPALPLIAPSNPSDIYGAWTVGQLSSLDKLRLSGQPQLGSVQTFYFSGDGCKDTQGPINLIVSDGAQNYSLVPNGAPVQIVNTGTIYFGWDRSRKSNWSDNCVEANNNVPVILYLDHCSNAGTTVACP
jgi:hypothetical protein